MMLIAASLLLSQRKQSLFYTLPAGTVHLQENSSFRGLLLSHGGTCAGSACINVSTLCIRQQTQTCQRVPPLSLQRRAEHKLTKASASVEHEEDEEDAFCYLTFLDVPDRYSIYIFLKASSQPQQRLVFAGLAETEGVQHGSVGHMQQVREGFLKQQKDGAAPSAYVAATRVQQPEQQRGTARLSSPDTGVWRGRPTGSVTSCVKGQQTVMSCLVSKKKTTFPHLSIIIYILYMNDKQFHYYCNIRVKV